MTQAPKIQDLDAMAQGARSITRNLMGSFYGLPGVHWTGALLHGLDDAFGAEERRGISAVEWICEIGVSWEGGRRVMGG